jgi:hypothetical protein
VTYTGTWSRTSSFRLLGGAGRATSSTTRRAAFKATVYDIGWVATKTPTSGKAQVWVDGVLVATVNLRSSTTRYRQLVYARHFTGLASHRMEIRPIGGGRVDLDAFVVLK